MSRIRSKDTRFEVRVRSALHRLGYRYRLHVPSLPGKPDLVFISRQKIVFLNGCFWHGHHCRANRRLNANAAYWTEKIAGNRDRDKRNKRKLARAGWKSLTVWECELANFDKLLSHIERFLH
jgi:DNA mismatch endonuclease (patch repair protein)